MSRRPSLASALKTIKAAGLSVSAVVIEGDNFRILTAAPQEPLSEIEQARERRRARQAVGDPYRD